MTRKKLLLVFNPKSGKGEFVDNLFAVVNRFTKSGFEVTTYPTQAKGDAVDMILRRAGDFDYLVCSGGDGTLSEAINALMQLESHPIFGYIPSGTTNDFANSLGLPLGVLQAAESICTGDVFPMDVGRFGDRYFAYVAAFGLFTDVSYDTSQGMKNIFGQAAYILEGAKRLANIKTFRCSVHIEDEEIIDDFILGMAANSTSIGGFHLFADDRINLDDGKFEVLLIRNSKNFIDTQNIIASLLNNEVYTESVVRYRATRMEVLSRVDIPWSLDGEFGGRRREVLIENCQKAVNIIVPEGSAAQLSASNNEAPV